MPKPALRDRLRQDLLLLDGGMGSQLIERGVQPTRGNDTLNLEAPEVVLSIHRDYMAAGSQALLTNSFGANAVSLKRHGLADQTEIINQSAAQITRQAAGQQGYVIGDIGPCGEFLEPLGSLRTDELFAAFAGQIRGLAAGQVDGFIIETMTALEEIEVAVQAVRSIAPEAVILTAMAYDRNPRGFRTMMGVAPERAVEHLARLEVDAVGFNCGSATLEEYVELTGIIATALKATRADIALLAEPNAGKPVIEQGEVVYKITPEEFSDAVLRMVDCGATLLGGCCGTTPAFIQAIASQLT